MDWLIRACQDRALVKDPEKEAQAARHMREAVESQPVLFTKQLQCVATNTKVVV